MSKETVVSIPVPDIQTMELTLMGVSPIVFHKWSEKAKKQILDKQQKKASSGKELRNPEADFWGAFYIDMDGHVAFPALAIKSAIINAGRSIDEIPMTQIRSNIFVEGDDDGMVKVLASGKPYKPSYKLTNIPEREQHGNIIAVDSKNGDVEMREDMVSLSGRGSGADLRYRPQIKNWSIVVTVKWNNGKFSREQVVNLLQYAGFGAGLGEWRPEKSGDRGTFKVQ